MALYTISAYFANQIPKIGSLPDRAEMYKEPLTDWERPAWVDFDWNQSGGCDSGWELIGHYELLSHRSSMLKRIFPGHDEVLCGKRGPSSFQTADRTQASQNWECPEGMQPCSSDASKPGSTFCTVSEDDFPVTYLQVSDRGNVPAST